MRWTAEPDAFVDTAAIIANLDLVVTADTAVAHLAGALGRPVWLALKHAPDWRWMLGRADSPWYPTMTLYRQSARDDWQGVFARMAQDLAKAVQRRQGGVAIRLQIPISIGELFDKITILEIKAARIADPAKLRHVTHELELLREIEGRLARGGSGRRALGRRVAASERNALGRRGRASAPAKRGRSLARSSSRLARSVYRHNDRRAELKKRLNALHGSELVEEKSYASSKSVTGPAVAKGGVMAPAPRRSSDARQASPARGCAPLYRLAPQQPHKHLRGQARLVRGRDCRLWSAAAA